jgi:hypothetical protein
MVGRQADLAQVVQAAGPQRRVAGPLHGGQQQAQQQPHNADDDQHLDQRDARPAALDGTAHDESPTKRIGNCNGWETWPVRAFRRNHNPASRRCLLSASCVQLT